MKFLELSSWQNVFQWHHLLYRPLFVHIHTSYTLHINSRLFIIGHLKCRYIQCTYNKYSSSKKLLAIAVLSHICYIHNHHRTVFCILAFYLMVPYLKNHSIVYLLDSIYMFKRKLLLIDVVQFILMAIQYFIMSLNQSLFIHFLIDDFGFQKLTLVKNIAMNTLGLLPCTRFFGVCAQKGDFLSCKM